MRWCLVVLLLVSGVAQAQEMKCPQVFMNASEKEVCANAQLLAMDRAMGTAYRAAEPHVDRIERDHRSFKKHRKACKGEVACLTALYEERIGVLTAAVPALAETQAAEEIPVPFPLPEHDSGAVVHQEAPGPLDPTAAEAVPQKELDLQSTAPSNTTEPPKDRGWGSLAVWGIIIVAALAKFISWVARFVRRCPKCSRWWGDEFDRDEKPHTRVIEVNMGHSGTTKRIHEVWTKSRLRCPQCGNEWVTNSKHRR